MWLIIPLIYLMSWRTCRRVGQALNETAAWIFGYLATAGLILALDLGTTDLVSATPDNWVAAVPLLAGFVGMAISRYRWKRRGGHLQPTTNRFTRALAAMRSPNAGQTGTKAAPRPRSTPRPAASRSLQRRASKPGSNRWVRALNAMLTSPEESKRRPGQ